MDCRVKPGNDEVKSERPSRRASVFLMQDFPVVPPIVIKDTPKPRRLTSLSQARAYVEPWRELWHRLKSVANEEDAIEAFGDMRELLAEEDLLLPSA